MQRLSNGTQVAAMPAPLAVSGTPGFATRGDPAAGLLASIFDADQYNRLQEELMAFLVAAGTLPNSANNAQVLAAVTALFPRRSEFTMQVTSDGALARLPGGLMIQSCQTPPVDPPGGGASVSYSLVFPTAFPTGCISISARDGGFAGFIWGAFSGITRFGATGYVWSQTAGTGARGAITAIGY